MGKGSVLQEQAAWHSRGCAHDIVRSLCPLGSYPLLETTAISHCRRPLCNGLCISGKNVWERRVLQKGGSLSGDTRTNPILRISRFLLGLPFRLGNKRGNN